MTQDTQHKDIAALQADLSHISSAPLSREQRAALERCIRDLEDLEGAFRNMETKLQESRQARSKFVSLVTHELRIPMTSIKGYADLLRSGVAGPINEQQQSFITIIHSNVERMSGLVSDLSDINHIETGRLNLELKSVPVADCIGKALAPLKPKLDEKGQVCTYNLPPDFVRVYADPNRVTQCLTTLISNANKYTPTGGRIDIRALQEMGFVCIEVEDNGIGISPADQSHVFTAFFRSEEAAVRDEPGWGLSLSLAKQLVELMNGEIGFNSILHEGSTFWIKMPISSEPE